MFTSRRFRWAQAACALLALAVLPGAKKCGSKEANETLLSPVQAVTTLLERADGTVDAELVLISTAVVPNAFVDTAKNVQLRVPDGTTVSLTLASSGHYTASSKTNSKLVYTPGKTYQFSFELDDSAAAKQVSGGHFVAVMDAPDDTVTFSLNPGPDFAGDTAKVEWKPTNRYALLQVRDANNKLSYSSFDFESSPEFDGSKWARLTSGGSLELGPDVFPAEGTYGVSLCATAKTSGFDSNLSAQLGALSGFLIGRCAQSQTLQVSK